MLYQSITLLGVTVLTLLGVSIIRRNSINIFRSNSVRRTVTLLGEAYRLTFISNTITTIQ